MSTAVSYTGLECNSEELIQIIHGCIRNERSAQERLYKMFYSKMMYMVKRYYEDEMMAEEILNNGFLKAFKNIPSFEFKGSFEGWLRKIIYHAVADYSQVQNKYKDNVVLLEKDVLIPKNHNNQLYYKDLMKLVHALPESSRIVFNLYVMEGLGHKEIGKIMNISEGTSKWHLSEARKQLKEKIEKLNLL